MVYLAMAVWMEQHKIANPIVFAIIIYVVQVKFFMELDDLTMSLRRPSTIPEGELEWELARWARLLAERGIYVVRCEHIDPREALERILVQLEELERNSEPGGVYLMVSEDCEECIREWEIEMADVPGQLQLF